jgi:hypothetical protein
MTLYAGRLERAARRIDLGRQVVGPDAMLTSSEALLWAKRGEFTRAERTIEQALRRQKTLLHKHHTLHTAAAVYSLVGRSADAIEQLRSTAADGFPNYPLFRDDPHFESLRAEPGYRALLRELRGEWESYRREFGRA